MSGLTIGVRQSSLFCRKFSLKIISGSAGRELNLSGSEIHKIQCPNPCFCSLTVASDFMTISACGSCSGLIVFVPLSLMPSQNSALHEFSQEIHFYHHSVGQFIDSLFSLCFPFSLIHPNAFQKQSKFFTWLSA